jgi:hypothetical protein
LSTGKFSARLNTDARSLSPQAPSSPSSSFSERSYDNAGRLLASSFDGANPEARAYTYG